MLHFSAETHEREVDTSDAVVRLRDDFPVLERVIDGRAINYLDSAATTLKPRAVIDAIVEYYTEVSANIHRGKHRLSEDASARYEAVRESIGAWLGVRSDEVVLTRNTTHGLNIIASGLGLGAHDTVVVGSEAHHASMLPWRATPARIALARHTEGGEPDLEHFEALLRERPAVVVLTHCSNVTGIIAPVAAMARMAKQAGATVVLDAAQSVPHGLLDLAELDVDFAAFSGHKMLGPTGVGVMWGRIDRLSTLRPLELGGGVVDFVESSSHRLRRPPHCFEAGTPDVAGVYGLGAAVEYVDGLPAGFVRRQDDLLTEALLRQAQARPYVSVLGRLDAPRVATLSIRIAGVTKLENVARALSDAHGVMCRSGHLCAQPLVDDLAAGQVLRLSAFVYNTTDEIEAAFEALDEVVRSFGLSVC